MAKREFDKDGMKIQHRSLTEIVLMTLANVLGFVADTALSRNEVYSVLNSSSGRKWSRANTNSWISSLSQRGYVSIRERDGQKSIELTNKAKLKIIENYARKRQKDKSYRFISFDIPEKMRLSRDRFRDAIKRIGFIQIQKSLWVINRDVTDLVEMATYEYRVENYVAYIISEKSDIDGIIERKLKKSLEKE